MQHIRYYICWHWIWMNNIIQLEIQLLRELILRVAIKLKKKIAKGIHPEDLIIFVPVRPKLPGSAFYIPLSQFLSVPVPPLQMFAWSPWALSALEDSLDQTCRMWLWVWIVPSRNHWGIHLDKCCIQRNKQSGNLSCCHKHHQQRRLPWFCCQVLVCMGDILQSKTNINNKAIQMIFIWVYFVGDTDYL